MSSMNFVATSVFFAQMAYIDNLGVRNVLLSDGTTIEGGMCHSDKNDAGGSLGLGDVRLWLGGSNPTEGKIRGYRDGTFVAAGGKAVFDKDGNTTIANLTATSGKFSGYIEKKKVVITPSNIDKYKDSSHPYLVINLTGTFIEFSGEFNDSPTVYLPSIGASVDTYPEEYKERVRSMVGNVALLYNKSNNNLGISGDIRENDDESPHSYGVATGYFCRLECRCRVVPSGYWDSSAVGYEEIYWVISRGKFK